jgi:hypothetical protein
VIPNDRGLPEQFGITIGDMVPGESFMLLMIAFLLFAALVVSWLVTPEHGREELPAAKPVSSPTMAGDVMTSKA